MGSRHISGRGKAHTAVLEECVRRFNERAHDAWWEAWKEMHEWRDPELRQITTSEVNRGGDAWTWDTLDEFIREYNHDTCNRATLECRQYPNDTHWHLDYEYDDLGPSAHLRISGPDRPALAYIGQPFDDWRIAAEKEFAAEQKRSRDAIAAAPEANALKRTWRWFRQSTDHEVIGGLVLVGVIASIGFLINRLAAWL